MQLIKFECGDIKINLFITLIKFILINLYTFFSF